MSSTRHRVLHIAVIALALLLLGSGALVRSLTLRTAPNIHVRWRDDISVERRQALERRFLLVHPEQLEGTTTTWNYDLLDTSEGTVRALVLAPEVADTHEIDRTAFQISPTAPPGGATAWWVHGIPVLREPWSVPLITTALVVLMLGSAAMLALGRRSGP